MAFKDLLVCLDDHPSVEARINVAIELARRWEAHLTGLHVVPLSDMPGYYTPEAVQMAVRLRRDAAGQFRQGLGARFEEALRRSGVAGALRVVESEVGPYATLSTRYSDLAILGQLDPDRPSEAAVVPDDVLVNAGRPALVIPYIGASGPIGERILVAWNAGREATRAVNDAMPLLTAARIVRVLSMNPERTGDHGEDPGADIALHLARHGVKTEVSTIKTDVDPADMLLSTAADFGADLIVSGAYGHSRAREIVLGGVTRHLLRHMTVPVFMSH